MDESKSDSRGRIVVVDDDLEMRALLRDFLTSEGYTVLPYPLAVDALKALRPGGELALQKPDGEVDVIISDIRMLHLDGMEFLEIIRRERPEIPVILITAFGSIETAIEGMRKGAFNYIIKPFKLAEISMSVARAREHCLLARDNTILREEVKKSWAFSDIIGKSAGMRAVFDLVNRVSHSISNVLITGESGSGKEMIARAIHNSGPRAEKPFIPINCTAIPETLLESELFGHAKGSFTGAIAKKRGLFEEANHGTLFLDEIGDMSLPLQVKLLRVIQEKKIRPVGDNLSHDVDVRIIAATHKDLKAGIKEGIFRDDLFYRLSVIPIHIPPLRDRKEDIPILADHFLKKYSATNGAKVSGFTKRAMQKLLRQRWDGNVRELENVIERAVVLSTQPLIDEQEVPDPDCESPESFFGRAVTDFPSLSQLEKRYITLVLEKTGGRKDKAAQILGINRRTLLRKEKEYGLLGLRGEDGDQPFEEEDEIPNSGKEGTG